MSKLTDSDAITRHMDKHYPENEPLPKDVTHMKGVGMIETHKGQGDTRVVHERDRIGEIQDRLRRIETRLTKWMQQCGFDTQTQKVEWDEEKCAIVIPSMDVRLKDILAAIPEVMRRGAYIEHKGNTVCHLRTQIGL